MPVDPDPDWGHLGYAGFGLKITDPKAIVNELADQVAAARKQGKSIDNFSIAMLLRERYETVFKLFDHVNGDTNPKGWGLVFNNPKENHHEHGYLFNLLRRFHLNRVYPELGISWGEFKRLPFSEAEFIFRMLGESKERVAQAANQIKNSMNSPE